MINIHLNKQIVGTTSVTPTTTVNDIKTYLKQLLNTTRLSNVWVFWVLNDNVTTIDHNIFKSDLYDNLTMETNYNSLPNSNIYVDNPSIKYVSTDPMDNTVYVNGVYTIAPDGKSLTVVDKLTGITTNYPFTIPTSRDELGDLSQVEYDETSGYPEYKRLVNAYFYLKLLDIFDEGVESIVSIFQQIMISKFVDGINIYLPPTTLFLTDETISNGQKTYSIEPGQSTILTQPNWFM